MATDSEMNRIGPIIAAVTISLLITQQAHARLPRITVLSVPENEPAAQEIIQVLTGHLLEMDILVEPWAASSLPEDTPTWLVTAAEAAADSPGTVVLFGYRCNAQTCSLYVVEPRSRSLVELPVQVPQHGDLSTAYALAATAREALLGPLFPELRRLALHGENPGPPPPSPDSAWLRPPLEEERQQAKGPRRPWLWLEGGYHGDHPHPDGHPIHGPWLGVVLEPREVVGVVLSVGWLGIREGNVSSGTARTHRLTSTLAVRIIFPIGPSHISVAPLVRIDAVFAEKVPAASATTSSTDVEIQAGGITTWHLPFSSRLEAVIGAGVLATILSEEYTFDAGYGIEETAIPSSVLRVIWLAGVSWSPL